MNEFVIDLKKLYSKYDWGLKENANIYFID